MQFPRVTVALTDQRAYVAVRNRQRHQPARTAGDVPGQDAAEAAGADPAVRVGRDRLRLPPPASGMAVGRLDTRLAANFAAESRPDPRAVRMVDQDETGARC